MQPQDDNRIDLKDVNKVPKQKRTFTAPSFKNPLKKQTGPKRDAVGQFTTGSGGLKAIKKFKWGRALPLIIVVALLGGFLVYRSFAGYDTGCEVKGEGSTSYVYSEKCVTDSVQATVVRMYYATFNRAPDSDGLKYWIDQLATQKVTVTRMAQMFMGSSEFKAKFGTLSNAAFVNAIYPQVLGRAPDAAGAKFWTDQLNNKTHTRESMLAFFVQSPEMKQSFKAKVAQALGISPDSGSSDPKSNTSSHTFDKNMATQITGGTLSSGKTARTATGVARETITANITAAEANKSNKVCVNVNVPKEATNNYYLGGANLYLSYTPLNADNLKGLPLRNSAPLGSEYSVDAYHPLNSVTHSDGSQSRTYCVTTDFRPIAGTLTLTAYYKAQLTAVYGLDDGYTFIHRTDKMKKVTYREEYADLSRNALISTTKTSSTDIDPSGAKADFTNTTTSGNHRLEIVGHVYTVVSPLELSTTRQVCAHYNIPSATQDATQQLYITSGNKGVDQDFKWMVAGGDSGTSGNLCSGRDYTFKDFDYSTGKFNPSVNHTIDFTLYSNQGTLDRTGATFIDTIYGKR